MTPEQFRTHGYQVINWIAQYYENLESYPVASRMQPGAVRSALPDSAPPQGEPFEHLLRDLDRNIMPGITHWQAPGFFAYFPANSSPASVLGDLVSSALGVQGMLWATSPACTELETHVLDWLVELLGLPAAFLSTGDGGGVIQDTASSSTLSALLAARERATGFVTNRKGVQQGDGGTRLVAYASANAHSSFIKAARIAGIGDDNIRLIPVDASYAMDAEALRKQMSVDRAAGHLPFFVCATVGTTASTAIDPVDAIAVVIQDCHASSGADTRRNEAAAADDDHGDDVVPWLHVDAAYAGSACVCPEHRYLNSGVERADSYTFNPHKWMLTNFDCNVFYVRDRRALTDTFAINPEYLRTEASDSGSVFDYRDWHIPLGRRFRSLKLWFVLRHYGVEGIQEYIRRHVTLAKELASWVEASAEFELAAPVPLSLVCFRHVGGDDVNRAIMARVNEGGQTYLTHAELDGRIVLRLAVAGVRTERRHVVTAWDEIQAAAEAVRG